MPIVNKQILDDLPSFNEVEIRFHIIDPTLKMLGYTGNEQVFLKLEEKLEYPYYHIGHKAKKKDLPLGFPDYRAGLKGRRGSFIAEAKAASIAISKKDIEQAHSYASHAQVGANYFILCNGKEFMVFETLSGPECKPICSIPLAQLDERFHELENILSPTNLAKNCEVSYDTGLKLCEGLGSAVKIHSGEYNMDDWEYRIFTNDTDITNQLRESFPQIAELDKQLVFLETEFILKVSEGIAERDENGRIHASLIFEGATKNNQTGMELLGIDKMLFSTGEKYLSIDPKNPTVFETTAEFSLTEGTMIPPMFGEAIPVDADVEGDLFITTRIHKDGDHLCGEYAAFSNYWINLPASETMKFEFDLVGKFLLKLAT